MSALLTIMAFLPAVVALVRGKVALALTLVFLLAINMALMLTVIAIPLCVVFWCVLLLVGLLAGSQKIVVVERR